MRLPKMGSMRSEAPSSCTSQLACPSQVRRNGSPTAGGVARRCTSAGTTGTWAVRGLFRLRPASLSSTAQRKTMAPACGPLPSWFRKRNMRVIVSCVPGRRGAPPCGLRPSPAKPAPPRGAPPCGLRPSPAKPAPPPGAPPCGLRPSPAEPRLLRLRDALLRLRQASFLVDEVEAHPQHRGDHRHQDGGEEPVEQRRHHRPARNHLDAVRAGQRHQHEGEPVRRAIRAGDQGVRATSPFHRSARAAARRSSPWQGCARSPW